MSGQGGRPAQVSPRAKPASIQKAKEKQKLSLVAPRSLRRICVKGLTAEVDEVGV